MFGERSAAGPRAGALLPERRRGEAHRRQGWVGGVYRSAPITARTATFDGQYASTRAARSAGLRFAVRSLSGAVDVGRDHLIHRKRSPFPYEGKALTRLNMGETFPIGRDTSRPVRFSRIGEKRFAWGAGSQVTSSTAERSPFPSRGRIMRPIIEANL